MLDIEDYNNMIPDEANRLYDRLLKHLTNTIMDNAIGAYSSSDTKLSSMFPNRSSQRDIDRIDNSESFRQNKGDIADR